MNLLNLPTVQSFESDGKEAEGEERDGKKKDKKYFLGNFVFAGRTCPAARKIGIFGLA